jgi:hypothetical protein
MGIGTALAALPWSAPMAQKDGFNMESVTA